MTSIQKILLPTNFTPACEQAREHALDLAERAQAELHVLHVRVLHGDQADWSGIPAVKDLEKAIAERSDRSLDEFTDGDAQRIVKATRHDITATPAILEYVEDNDIDLIVMGTHARQGLSRLFLGSQAAEVVRSTDVPVMVVGPHQQFDDGYDCVLAAVDFSESSTLALRQAADIARLHGASLVAVHVADTQYLPPYSTSAFEQRARSHAEGELASLLDRIDLPVEVEAVVVIGRPYERIVDIARDYAAELIVMGTQGTHGIERFLLGSVTERVMRTAPCPVLAHRGDLSMAI